MISCDFSSRSCVLGVLLGGREGERSVDVGFLFGFSFFEGLQSPGVLF